MQTSLREDRPLFLARGPEPVADAQLALVARPVLGRAHRALDRLLLRVEALAGVTGTFEVSELSGVVDVLLQDLDKTLLPHMAWEDQVCFPAADRLAATPWATQVLRLQHDHLRGSLDRLRVDGGALHLGPSRSAIVAVRAHLYAFDATLAAHLEQEEATLSGLLGTPPARSRVADD